MAKERWSREYATCQGWDDQQGHHACGSPALPHNAGGRCIRCYAMHRKALGQTPRDPFPSVNDELFPGDPRPDAGAVKEPVMVNGHRDTAVQVTAKSVVPVTLTKMSNGHEGAPNFEVFTLIGPVRQSGPSLTLRADGRLSVNEAAYDILGRPLFVELLYDRKGLILGVRAATSTVAHAREMRSEKAGGARRYINVRPLLAHYDIAGARTGNEPAKQYGDVLAVRLTLPEQAKGR